MRKAFTLIELLVVIAVIAILAAILFPVFSQVREKARQASCLSNCKQIATGLSLYAQDYDGHMPPAQLPALGPNFSWPTIMFPYIKNDPIFTCASGERGPRAVRFDSANGSGPTGCPGTYDGYVGVTVDDPTLFGGMCGDGTTYALGCVVHQLSYGRNVIRNRSFAWATFGFCLNDVGFGCNPPKSGFVRTGTTLSVHEAEIEDPAGTVHIVDAWTRRPTGGGGFPGNSIRGITEEIRTDRWPHCTPSKVANRHMEGFNAIFGDGHAKWRKYGTTKVQEWSIQMD